MRKEYVKPVMESEEFVSNEYVATCYTVTCTSCEAIEEGDDSLAAKVKTSTINGYTINTFSDVLGGKEPCNEVVEGEAAPDWADDNIIAAFIYLLFKDYLKQEITADYHYVEVEKGWTVTNRPNAS